MKSSDKLKQLVGYLDKNYYIDEDKFFTKHGNLHEWGLDISKSLVSIFSFDGDFCDGVLKYWAYFNDLPINAIDDAWKARGLNAVWTTEIAQDLEAFHGIDIEAELTALVAAEVTVEIDRERY